MGTSRRTRKAGKPNTWQCSIITFICHEESNACVQTLNFKQFMSMEEGKRPEKVIVVGAGPVGSLAALYAANRGNDVEIYELRGGM
jgi:NADPH-dependent 2,4-dienoyl-CoA reductase/sulfur reductase-like enzyme